MSSLLSIIPGDIILTNDHYLHVVESLLCALLRLIRVVGVVDGRLQTTGDIVWVLVTTRRRCGLDLSTIVGLLEDIARVLLRLFRSVCVRSACDNGCNKNRAHWGC